MSQSIQAMLQVAAKCGLQMSPSLQQFITSIARSVDQLAQSEAMWRKRAEGLNEQFKKLDDITKQRLQAEQRATEEKGNQVPIESTEETEALVKYYEERTANTRGKVCSFGPNGERIE